MGTYQDTFFRLSWYATKKHILTAPNGRLVSTRSNYFYLFYLERQLLL